MLKSIHRVQVHHWFVDISKEALCAADKKTRAECVRSMHHVNTLILLFQPHLLVNLTHAGVFTVFSQSACLMLTEGIHAHPHKHNTLHKDRDGKALEQNIAFTCDYE